MIGYYVHHVGHGHLSRALAVAGRSRWPVTGLSSLPRPHAWTGDWITLPMDDGQPVIRPTRGGSWHWVPSDHRGFGERMRIVAGWLGSARPTLLVSDVSVEIVVLAALLGVRSCAVLLHGRRDDAPHRLGHTTADLLLAPWPPSHVQPWHRVHASALVATGAFGPDDARAPSAVVPGRVVVMVGAGPHAVHGGDVAAAAAATPSWDWHTVGLSGVSGDCVTSHGWLDDAWPVVSSAEVVVSTAGDGSVAQIAAAGRPAVLIPQDRPFGEQHALGRCVAAMASAPALISPGWPEASHWDGLLGRATALDGGGWGDYLDGTGADRFAQALDEAAA